MPIKGFTHFLEHTVAKITEIYGIFRDFDYNHNKCKIFKKQLIPTDRIPYIDDENGELFFLSWRALRYSLSKAHYKTHRWPKDEDDCIKKILFRIWVKILRKINKYF